MQLLPPWSLGCSQQVAGRLQTAAWGSGAPIWLWGLRQLHAYLEVHGGEGAWASAAAVGSCSWRSHLQARSPDSVADGKGLPRAWAACRRSPRGCKWLYLSLEPQLSLLPVMAACAPQRAWQVRGQGCAAMTRIRPLMAPLTSALACQHLWSPRCRGFWNSVQNIADPWSNIKKKKNQLGTLVACQMLSYFESLATHHNRSTWALLKTWPLFGYIKGSRSGIKFYPRLVCKFELRHWSWKSLCVDHTLAATHICSSQMQQLEPETFTYKPPNSVKTWNLIKVHKKFCHHLQWGQDFTPDSLNIYYFRALGTNALTWEPSSFRRILL